MNPRKAKNKISAIFEFTQTGMLKTIYLNAESIQDEKILQKGLDRIINPYHLGWFRRLLKG